AEVPHPGVDGPGQGAGGRLPRDAGGQRAHAAGHHRRSRRRGQVLHGDRGRQDPRPGARRGPRGRRGHADEHLRRRRQDPEGRARCQRGVHAGPGEGRRQHGEDDGAAAPHQQARVQADPGEAQGRDRAV
ncbi:MAG: hypothetical protein AVDCRST_MAG20-1036, partial [uncultured Acidimicrobiales bacterium]